MALKKKESIWNDAIEKKNTEANKQREASEFFASNESNKMKKKNEEENFIPQQVEIKEVIKEVPVVEEKIVYTSKKPITSERHTKKEKRKIWTIFGVFMSAVLTAILVIPLIMLGGWGARLIDDALSARQLIGYEVNVTEFSVKHEESGLYLQPPTYQGEQLLLMPEEVNTFKFSGEDTSDEIMGEDTLTYDEFWLDSNMIFNGVEMTMSIQDGKPVWSGGVEESPIHLVKKGEHSNQVAIGFSDERVYIAKDENSNNLVLSNEPDWFTLETEVAFIKTFDEYQKEYTRINEEMDFYSDTPEAGADGNPLAIQSYSTDKWINSYKYVGYDGIVSHTIDDDEYVDSIYLDDRTDSNMFIFTDTAGNMALSSYQTLPFTPYATSEAQKFYPLVTANDDGTISLELYDLNVIDPVILANTNFWLLPNPHNLREKAIYFPSVNGFLDTRTGSLTLQTISDESELDTLDYFGFYHSQYKNPEYTKINSVERSISPHHHKIRISNENPDGIDGFEFYGFSYDTREDALSTPLKYNDTVKDVADGRRANEKVELQDLTADTWYQGVILTYKDSRYNVAKNVTYTYVPPFHTSPEWKWPWDQWPDINWPDIEWPEIEPIDPGMPEEGEPSSTIIWDSTDEVGPDTDPANDVSTAEMLTSADDSIEVSVTLTQGTVDGVTDKLGIYVEEVDDTGAPVSGGYKDHIELTSSPEDGKTYSTIITGLKPETNYKISVELFDGSTGFVQDEKDGIMELDTGNESMWATTERVAPTTNASATGIDWNDAGFSIYGTINDLRPTDEIQISLKDKNTGDRINTGWIKASEWETADVAGWSFGYNESGPYGPYYSATYDAANTSVTYDVYMWVRMDVTTDFKGWDADSPAFDILYNSVMGESQFDVLQVQNQQGVVYEGA